MLEDEDTVRQAERRIGTVLGGKYRVDRVLGVGGMAIVYAATHRNRKRFAVKVLHEELSVRRDIRDRFLREGYVANSVDHPGVIAVLDDDVDASGCAFLVMELLEGAPVDALCRGMTAPLPVRVALSIAHQLLDVLEAAHAKDIVHRDIKPANLFVLRDGAVKVLDFGIARLRDLTSGIKSTRAGALLGTPAFMAPEQAMAQGGEIDPRTDLWAAGATLFTMIAGQFVHPGENGRQMLIRAATLPARSLKSIAPDAPDPVVDLVAKALAFDKEARWSSAAAMRDEVGRIQRELFGGDVREPLRSYVQTSRRTLETDPTEPSSRASSNPGTPAESVGPTLASVAPSDVVTTTGKPISTPRDAMVSRPPRRTATAWTAVGVVVLVGAVTLSLRRSPPPPLAPAAPPGPVSAPQDPLLSVPAPPAKASTIPASPELPQAGPDLAPPSASVAVKQSITPPAKPTMKSSTSPAPSGLSPSPQASAAPTPIPSARPAPSPVDSAALSSDPLRIHLQ